MAGQYGVKETEEALELGLAVAQAVKGAKGDGSINAGDVVHLIPVVAKVGPALSDVEKIPKELGELDKEDATALLAFAASKLPGLGDEKLVAVAGKSLAVAVAVAELVSELKSPAAEVSPQA